MTLDEFKNFTIDILSNLQDQGKVSEILTNLVDDYSEVSTNMVALSESNKKILEDMESIRSANMKLFLKLGDKPEVKEPTPEEKEQDIPQSLNFENLFTKEGGLK